MEIDISEEIDLTNITQYLTNNKNNNNNENNNKVNNNNNNSNTSSKAIPHVGIDTNYLDVHKKFTFGLKSFCVETRYQTLHTVEKQCQKISIFHKDLEEAGRSQKIQGMFCWKSATFDSLILFYYTYSISNVSVEKFIHNH